MSKENRTEYHYEMVVNIVADMVIEYLEATARDIDKKPKQIKPGIEAGADGKAYQAKKAA